MTTDILDAINLLLVERWPEVAVYRDAVPQDFERPGFLIELVRERREPANIRLSRVESFFTITAFEPIDEYGRMATPELLKDYLKELIFKTYTVSRNRIAFLLLSVPGVADYSSLTINGMEGNMSVGASEIPVLDALSITEVV